ncbi:3,4-dihydroxy-2-butanone-4-phosphate synthase [Micrococcus sp.]|uniref:3,4-dihydroxy-2-butanone-4-phosphate synthase n=1 Tax=Micrococcus sp. TaxID=1271 RepID=UPI002A90D8FF|nr:3,4-dihydroxy-2-butanone-4-phosphate synthase [Micrococcus sp.]MDY6054770.1 3,4-dihydroxy-2-butanone-4-phosphate synthase [Micrococcus sp.]
MSTESRPGPDAAQIRLDPVPEAVAALAAGRPVVVVDDADRENEGDLIYAAALATDAVTAFTVRHTSGVICAPMPTVLADRLGLPPMTAVNEDPKGTAYTVSVDAAAGVSTGISAADRTRTLHVLAGEGSAPADLTRPGHVFPLRAVPGGVRARRGHTEAGVELCELAGLPPVAAIAELVHDDGTMMRLPALRDFADEHGLALISIEDLVAHLDDGAARPAPVPAEAALPTAHGDLRLSVHPDPETGAEHVLLWADPPAGTDPDAPVTVRVHSECLTGDVFGSLRCDCGPQLHAALDDAARHGGAVLYLRGQEGRGIGLTSKIRAYRLQDDAGLDTVDANLALGLPAEARTYAGAARVLADAGLTRIRLVTNNPAKVTGLREAGIDVVERLPAPTPVTAHNAAYLRTKRDRMAHALTDRDLSVQTGPEHRAETPTPADTVQEDPR